MSDHQGAAPAAPAFRIQPSSPLYAEAKYGGVILSHGPSSEGGAGIFVFDSEVPALIDTLEKLRKQL